MAIIGCANCYRNIKDMHGERQCALTGVKIYKTYQEGRFCEAYLHWKNRKTRQQLMREVNHDKGRENTGKKKNC